MTADLERAFGRVMLRFSSLEFVLVSAIWLIIDHSNAKVGMAVTAGENFRRVSEMFRYVTSARFGDEHRLAVEAADLAARAGQLAARRNELVHSTWLPPGSLAHGTGEVIQDVVKVRFQDRSGRRMRFKVSDVREVEKLVQELDAVYQEAVDLANRIARELGLASPRPRRRKNESGNLKSL